MAASLVERGKNVLRALLQARAPGSVKKRLWDSEFAGGRWSYIDETTADLLYPILARHLRGGRVLDLGCGAGNTGVEMQAESYASYVGVDISAVALEKAAARSEKAGRSEKNDYAEGDIFSYEPQGGYDVILFRECLFYIPLSKILVMLRRYQINLRPEGVFIVRMCDRYRYRKIVELIRDNFQVVEEVLPEGIGTVVMVFR